MPRPRHVPHRHQCRRCRPARRGCNPLSLRISFKAGCLSDANTRTAVALPNEAPADRLQSSLSCMSICDDALCFKMAALGFLEKHGKGKREGRT